MVDIYVSSGLIAYTKYGKRKGKENRSFGVWSSREKIIEAILAKQLSSSKDISWKKWDLSETLQLAEGKTYSNCTGCPFKVFVALILNWVEAVSMENMRNNCLESVGWEDWETESEDKHDKNITHLTARSRWSWGNW